MVNRRRIQITEAEYWVDESGFTVRSREFDCFATGHSLGEALRNFDQAVLRYAEALQAREENGEATASEREVLKRLSARLSRIYLEERRSEGRRRKWLRRRWSGRHDREWGPVPA